MAGIAGICTSNSEIADKMLSKINYRGPHGRWKSQYLPFISLGCCENKASKTQTHATVEGENVVLDGHLYNPQREEFGDAKLILRFYEKFGTQFPEKLDGDFACAIANGDELVLVRDSIGLKPLYWGYSNGKLCFASEAKALAEVAQEIEEFPPGNIYTTKLGFQRFMPEVKTPDFETKEEAKRILVDLLAQAVEKRMKDNAPEGVILSGGLDSSIIACLAKEIRPDIKAFTVTVEGGEDLPRAQDLARYLGIEHQVYKYGEKEIREALPEAIYYLESFEEDDVRGAVAHFFASKLASQ
jgi:asparagine synthase (glutamine-hydrolysing)